jgi:hypothetical protein
VIGDPSVAEHHAEVVTVDDGAVFVVDCGTPSRTWRRVHRGDRSAWKPFRQAFVGSDEVLRLGDHVCLMSDILASLAPRLQARTGDLGRQGKARPRGRLARDPLTGEIVRRRS